jgi:hypothetical protein
MSCCGQKRQALAVASSNTVPETLGVSVESKEETGTTFRYTGAGSLVINGLFGRNAYKFSSAVRELAIGSEDVAIMRAHPELTELRVARASRP